MGKKIKKKKMKMEFPAPTHDPMLEEVDEERSLEIEYDEETNEVVMVCHYRRHWGDEFDADIEHLFTMEENERMITVLLNLLETQRKVRMKVAEVLMENKSTPELVEGNPIKENKQVEPIE